MLEIKELGGHRRVQMWVRISTCDSKSKREGEGVRVRSGSGVWVWVDIGETKREVKW